METKYDNVFINPTDKEISQSIIAFDMDSVLNTMGYDLGLYVANAFGTTLDKVRDIDPVHGFDRFHFIVPGATDSEVGKVVVKFIMEESPSSLPSVLMAEVLKWVYIVTDCPIQVVTYRPARAVGVTKRWLEKNLNGTPFRIYIQHGVPKHVTLRKMNCSIFIDDRWSTIKALLSYIEYPIIYRQPWNQGRPTDLGVLQIRDLRDLIPLINIGGPLHNTVFPLKPYGERK